VLCRILLTKSIAHELLFSALGLFFNLKQAAVTLNGFTSPTINNLYDQNSSG